MKMGISLTPAAVAQNTLDALEHRGPVWPGWLSKALEASLMLLPRWGRVRIMAFIMAGMTRHHLARSSGESR